ncbi:expressed unknown protein [Seminavis robusta]|uniref:Phosphoglycerate mutase n=1 Tax=Seminavis robusta TaxID=568900 RepID=A0A9N8H1Q6_9STRA|nr:expressed unknown protein [Seminavis robusta]|eukprot:Sro21_g014630.1 n/a (379) ;mRNA; f:62117-63253
MNPSTAGTTPSNGNNDVRTIRVILLRHGEREDEAEDYDKHQRSRRDRIDPFLTAFGHRQALNAWKQILRALQEVSDDDTKPMLLATSPLRRCIGTAMMVAAAQAQTESTLQFVLPSQQATGTQDAKNPIPLLVMNGLGDCAAQMQHMGGIGKVIQAGWLDCAASPSNDCNSNNDTPIKTCLTRMAKAAATVAQAEAVKDQSKQNHDEIHTSVPLQFWRESTYYTKARTKPLQGLAPLTHPKSLAEHAATTIGASANPSTDDPTTMQRNAPYFDERCAQALERAVWRTVHSGLDTCVLVTHREAIRFVEGYWASQSQQQVGHCGAKHRNISRQNMSATKLYCCVGIYSVSVDMTTHRVLGWQAKGVVPYQTLQSSHLQL